MNVLEDKKWLEKEYVENQRSAQEIAKELNTYKQKVRRALIKHNIPIRSASDAQKLALEHGRSHHPTVGTKRSAETKLKIAETCAQNWADLSDRVKKERAELLRQRWFELPEHKREEILKKARDGVRKASKDGSKLEKMLEGVLTEAGFMVQYHKKGLIPNVNLEVDMFLPEISTAIEIDGPSHFFPIWGDENFQRNIKADIEKTGLILNQGMVMIRVKQMSSKMSKLAKTKLLAKILEEVKKIKEKFPEENDRLIEVEI